MSQLGLEIDKMSPQFAIDFVDECYSVLSSLRYVASQKKKDLIKSELRKSSQSNLDYLDYSIKK